MSRRNALLVAFAVGLATIAALVLARRRTAAVAAPTTSASGAVPAPAPPGAARAATPSTAPLAPAAAPIAAVPPAAPEARSPDLPEGEQPLPAWARIAIVGAALLAFLAVSLIATRSS